MNARLPMRSVMVAALLFALLTGCAGLRGAGTAPQTWRLDLPAKLPAAPDGGPGATTLVIGPPRAAPGFESPRMLYSRRPHELAAFASHEWVDTPARMLGAVLAETLARSGDWFAVVTTPGARGDYRLDVTDLTLVQEFAQVPGQVRLGVRVQLVAIGSRRVLASHSFEVIEPTPSEDPYGGVIAANRAVASLLAELRPWVANASTAGE
jgi:cholesterol transport system auxiliary component